MLKDYLPAYYKKSKVMADILGALETECTRLGLEIQHIEDAFFVLLAEKYIDRHLSDLGLPTGSEGIGVKRSLILARLQGTGTLTKAVLKSIAESFIAGYIEVTEFPDWYAFHIDYDDTGAAPEAVEGLRAVVEELKPAHLAFEILSYFVSWTRLDGFDYTWAQWDALDLTFDEWEVYHQHRGEG